MRELAKVRHQALITGVVGAILCAVGGVLNHDQFFRSYLFGYLFWFGIAAGCLGLLMMYRITGGAWGDVIRPLMESGAATLPWLALLFVPLCFGLHSLYPWSHPDVVAAQERLAHNHPYLNAPFFYVRAAIYFIVLGYMGLTQADPQAGGPAGRRRGLNPAPGLVLYVLLLTFVSVDWMMSLEPLWYSTVYEMMVIVGQGLAAFTFLILARRWLAPPPDLAGEAPAKPFIDLGNMLLAFIMFWAYTAFSQYLVIWSGNMPEEIAWYLRRQQGGWFWVAMAIIVFQFAVPFCILLGRRNKATIERLAVIAAIGFAAWSVNLYWMVAPPFHPQSFHLHWLDFIAPAAVGGFWIAAFLTRLQAHPGLAEATS